MLDPALRAALDAADKGQRDGALEALAQLERRDGDFVRACQLAAQSRLWLTDPRALGPPSHEQLAAFLTCNAEARVAASLACSAAATSCVLGLDVVELDSYNALNAELLGSQPHGVAAGWLTLCRSWAEVIRGESSSVDTRLESLRTEAVDAQAAVLAVEATALRSLAALNDGNIPVATERARRASRMARTEAIPRAELLAHLVLARLRRISGKPHLAARILSSLIEFAAPPWHPWMLWELTLSGGQGETADCARPFDRI